MTRMYADAAGRVLALDTDGSELAKAAAAIVPDTAGMVVFRESSIEALGLDGREAGEQDRFS